jgi:hypothetical protein
VTLFLLRYDRMRTLSSRVVVAAALAARACAAPNGLAIKPTMGTNLWNTFFCSYTDEDLKACRGGGQELCWCLTSALFLSRCTSLLALF